VHSYLGSQEYQSDVVVVNIVEKYLSAEGFYADGFGESLKAKDISSLRQSWENSKDEYVSTGCNIIARETSSRLVDNKMKHDDVYCCIFSPVGNVVIVWLILPEVCPVLTN
jgi:hypothetical protein